MVKLMILRAVLSLGLMLTLNNTNGNNQISAMTLPEVELPEVVITAKKSSKSNYAKTFLGFNLEGKLDTSVTAQLKQALIEYDGPEVNITSLKRHWGTKSAHECGNAFDTRLCPKVIDWLVSEKGQEWLNRFNLIFYIEGRPGSKALKPYKANEAYRKYVFENPHARGKTGDHLHFNIRK